MPRTRPAAAAALVLAASLGMPGRVDARTPPNPFSSFNLSGINYGSMQWERAQREGRRVWPYYNSPARGVVRGGGPAVGVQGRGFRGGTIRSGPRRWRR